MGYFSYTCAKTGLPIASHDSGCDKKHYQVVLVLKNGRPHKGDYDGYGRAGGEDTDIGGETGSKLVLARYWKGETWEQLGKNESDPNQGSFDPIFDTAIFHAQDTIEGFDGRQYLKRLREVELLMREARGFMESEHGFSYSNIWNLSRALDRADYADPEDRDREVAAALSEAVGHFPGGELPVDHPMKSLSAHELLAQLEAKAERLEMAVVTEVVSAWGEKRPTRQPQFPALLRGETAHGAGWTDASAPEAAPSRPRMKA